MLQSELYTIYTETVLDIFVETMWILSFKSQFPRHFSQSDGYLLFAISDIYPLTTTNIWQNHCAIKYVFHSEVGSCLDWRAAAIA